MKKFFKVILGVLEVLLICYVIAITTCLLCQNKYGLTELFGKTLVIVNKENEKELANFQKGDLVLLDQVDAKSVKEGDTLYYYATEKKEYVLRSGVVASRAGEENAELFTLDGEKKETISAERVLGTYSGTSYRTIGGILEVLESRVGFLLLVILPIMILFIYQIYSLILMVKNDKEEEAELRKQLSKEQKKKEIETL